jgi:integrase
MSTGKLTKTYIDKLPIPERDKVFYRDAELKGFGLYIRSSGAKVFIVEKRINGKVKRITLGRYGELTAEQARKQAQAVLGKIAIGHDPIAEKKEQALKAVTLGQVFEDYLKARRSLKPTTVFDYRRVMRESFSDWQDKPILSITKEKVEKRHEKLGERSLARANLSMRVLRALFNFAMGKYEDSQGRSLIAENPVKRLSQIRCWYRVNRRQTVIKAHELKSWFQGVMQLPNETLRDYLLLMLFTGLRRQEAATLKWSDVDLTGKTLTVRDTKNRLDHTLPLSDFLFDLLKSRFEKASNEFVFPGSGAGGYIVEPRKQMAKVTVASGVNFILHDLRRTFTTIAESLDISAYAVKLLVNHKINGDITGYYIISDVERLRRPMQKITDYLLKCAGVQASAEVVPFEKKTTG